MIRGVFSDDNVLIDVRTMWKPIQFFLKPTFRLQIFCSTALPLRSEIPTSLARQTHRIGMSWQVVMDFKIVPTGLQRRKSTVLSDAIRT